MKTPTGLKKLNIKLTVILGFVLMVSVNHHIAAMGYVALREAIEDATLYSALSRDTNLAHDIGNSMLILNGALGSYLANRDVQSVWEVDYRLALTRRMAKMAHKSNLNPEPARHSGPS